MTSGPPALLTVVMAVHNEQATLRTALERLLEVEMPCDLDVLVVDDSSTDGGPDTIADLLERSDVRLIRLRTRVGKGGAVRAGIDAAKGQMLVCLDADLEYDPANIPALLYTVTTCRADVVYGVRSASRHAAFSFWYFLGNRALSLWASVLFNAWVTDVETCLKLAPTALWRELELTSDGFDIEAEVTAKLLERGSRICEVPASYVARSRADGKKIRAFDGVTAAWMLLRIRLTGSKRS